MFTTLLHHDTENAIATRYDLYGSAVNDQISINVSVRSLAVIALLTAVIGGFALPLLAAIPLGHYVLATTDKDTPETDLRTPVTRGIAAIALIVSYVWVAVLLFAWIF